MPSCMCFVDHLVIMDDLIFHILQPLTKNASCMWRCTIKQHPKLLCEKFISQPWLVQKPFLFHPTIVQPKYYYSRSRSFPRMEASDSLSRILGMGFFHSLPIPEIWEWIFLFPSRSRISGMGFFNSLPVPEFREWAFSIPFPFPNPQKSFPLTPAWQNFVNLSSRKGRPL